MKTTLNINDRLLQQAKVFAAKQRTTLTKLIEEGLVLRLRPPAAQAAPFKVDLPVIKGGRLNPGINPLSNKSLLGEDES